MDTCVQQWMTKLKTHTHTQCYTHSGILLSYKKEENLVHNSVDGP